MTISSTKNVHINEDWSEPGGTANPRMLMTRAEWLWTFFGIALLIVFVVLVVNDYSLPTIIAGR